MYNNDYENYMRSVLGYPIQNEMNTYNAYDNVYERNNTSYFPYRYDTANYNSTKQYEDFYPEIYKILKPMIKKICNNSTYRDISQDTIETMVDEIYTNIESDINVVNVNINTTPETDKASSSTKRDMKITKVQSKEDEMRNSNANPILRDLIKIMLINQLIQNNRTPRPGPAKPFLPRPPYRELEDSSIYSNNYIQGQGYPYY